MTEGLALVLGRWLDRPGWGSIRRRVGSCLAKPQAEATESPRLRLETPSGTLIEAVEYVEGETAWECAKRTHPRTRDIVLCGADLTPLDPASSVGAVEVLVAVVARRNIFNIWEHAKNNKLGLLRWAIAHGCRWHIETSRYAAENGHLELLQWAIANGCPWHPGTSCFAAKFGHLELLQWAIANGCKRHPSTSWFAAKYGHLKLLQWALANDCPPSEGTLCVADSQGHTEIVAWLGTQA